MKPKARFVNGQWIVWDGVSFHNGCSTHPELKHAYGYWVMQCLKSKIPQSFGRTMRFSKTFVMERSRES